MRCPGVIARVGFQRYRHGVRHSVIRPPAVMRHLCESGISGDPHPQTANRIATAKYGKGAHLQGRLVTNFTRPLSQSQDSRRKNSGLHRQQARRIDFKTVTHLDYAKAVGRGRLQFVFNGLVQAFLKRVLTGAQFSPLVFQKPFTILNGIP